MAYVNPEAGYIQVTDSVTGQLVPIGTVFVIHILPTIIFFSSLMALLYHLGVMQTADPRHGLGHAQDHGHQRQRELLLRRQRLRGPDRGAPGDPALPADHDPAAN